MDQVDTINAAIKSSGLSLNRLGQACGIDSTRMSRFVRRKRHLSLEAYWRLCDILNLELRPANSR